MSAFRLDLSKLRRTPAADMEWPDPRRAWYSPGSFALSRRQLLIGATVGSVGLSPIIKAFGAALVPFDLVREEKRIVFVVNGIRRWIIDPDRFAGKPLLNLSDTKDARGERYIRITLSQARFPGTQLPADMEAEISPGLLGTRLHMRFALGGFDAEVPFGNWLTGTSPLQGKVRISGTHLSLGRQAGVAIGGDAQASFTPDWRLRLEGQAVGALEGWGEQYISNTVTVGVLEADAHSIRSRPVSRRTLVALERDKHPWAPWPLLTGALASEVGQVVGRQNHLDLIRVEAGETSSGEIRTALLAEALATETAVFFQYQGDLTAAKGKPLRLPLEDVRFAVEFNQTGDEAAVVGRFAPGPVEAHVNASTLALGVTGQTPAFEVTSRNGKVEGVQCCPAVVGANLPVPGAMVRTVKLAEGTHLDLAPAGATAAGARAFAITAEQKHIVAAAPQVAAAAQVGAAAHMAALQLPVDEISVIRPADLLVLTFKLHNLALDIAQQNWVRGPGDAYLVVAFPPQHFAEESFPETGAVGTPPIRAVAAQESRLAFKVPPTVTSIPNTLAGLLNWNLLTPSVYTTLNTQVGPAATETSVEVPYRLLLSPDETAIWQHSLEPRATGGWTELWHTSLRPENAQVRAVWTPDFDPGAPARDPFLMVPGKWDAAQDRQELVHLTMDDVAAKPVAARHLMLSSQGAWLDSTGTWDSPNQNITLWRQQTVMGRDQFVRIVKKGFLYPFGHRAILDTIVERKLTEDGVAYLRKKQFLVVLERNVTYPVGHRGIPFPAVEILEAQTPLLDQVENSAVGSFASNAFWPKVQQQDFIFNLRAKDWEGATHHFSTPLIFVAHTVATNAAQLATVTAAFEGDSRRKVDMQGQLIAYAAPSIRVVDGEDGAVTSTSYETDTLRLSAQTDTGDRPFLPKMTETLARLMEVEVASGQPAYSWLQYWAGYIQNGFDAPDTTAPKNVGEVYLEVCDNQQIAAGNQKASKPRASFSGDQGGMLTPDQDIRSISRTGGSSGDSPADKAAGKTDLKKMTGTLLGFYTIGKLLDVANTELNNLLPDDPRVPQIRIELAKSSNIMTALKGLDKSKIRPHIYGIRVSLTWRIPFPWSNSVFFVTKKAKPYDQPDIPPTVTSQSGGTFPAGTWHFALTWVVDTPGHHPYVKKFVGESEGETLRSTASGVVNTQGNQSYRVTAGTFAKDVKRARVYATDDQVNYYYCGDITQSGGSLVVTAPPNPATQPLAPKENTAVTGEQTSFYLSAYYLQKFDNNYSTVPFRDPPPRAPGPGSEKRWTVGVAFGVANFALHVPYVVKINFVRLGLNVTNLAAKATDRSKDKKSFANRLAKVDEDLFDMKLGDTPLEFEGPLLFIGTLAVAMMKVFGDSFLSGLKGVRTNHNYSNTQSAAPSAVGLLAAGSVSMPAIDLAMKIPFPNFSIGMFGISNIGLLLGISFPLSKAPLTFKIGLCDIHDPFTVNVTIFGGGGAFVMTASPGGLVALEMTIEIGLVATFSVAVASGRIYCFIGIYVRLEFQGSSMSAKLTGYVRAGGEFDVLGIVSASMTFMLSLTYDFKANLLWGEAELTVSISLLFFSISVSWTVTREFAGGGGASAMLEGGSALPQAAERPINIAVLDEYCAAFSSTYNPEVKISW